MPPLTVHRRSGSALGALTLVLGSALAVIPTSPAQAAGTPFVVIGTSDVSDSNLVASVLEPGFEAAYPEYDLQYVAKGTGAAITDAKNGLAAALIVHAASIENQFVDPPASGPGSSFNDASFSIEEFGRLVFWGDYVLLGPNDDPANVGALAPHDIVKAFELVAASGVAGQSDFISRGGTPGTAVQERALWALTTGVPTCAVGAPSGGGARPKDPSSPSTICTSPDDVTYDPPNDATGAPFPSWYHTGVAGSQASNVNLANTCSTATNPSGKCYVFTDRGTYKYLRSTGLAQNLQLVTRDNNPTARGGTDALVNVFHAYGVNPAAFANPGSTKTDLVAANKFLDFITSPDTQAAIGAHLSGDGDKAFVPAAAPSLTAEITSDAIDLSKRTTITGHLANVVPGYPALNGVTVNLLEVTPPNGGIGIPSIPTVVATTTTDATGNFTFKKVLTGGKRVSVGVGKIRKIELPSLSPPFGSLLTSTATTIATLGDVALTGYTVPGNGTLKTTFAISPAPTTGRGKVVLYGGLKGQKLKKLKTVKIANGKKRVKFRVDLGTVQGKYRVQAVYKDGRVTLPILSKIEKVALS